MKHRSSVNELRRDCWHVRKTVRYHRANVEMIAKAILPDVEYVEFLRLIDDVCSNDQLRQLTAIPKIDTVMQRLRRENAEQQPQ